MAATDMDHLSEIFEHKDVNIFFRHFKDKRNTFSFHVITHSLFYEQFKKILHTPPFLKEDYIKPTKKPKQKSLRCGHTKNFGYDRKKKMETSERVKVLKCKDANKKDSYTYYTFPAMLFNVLLARIMCRTKWRFNVRNLSQVPPALYQAIRLANFSVIRVFPYLSQEREDLRDQLYPIILDKMVCVLRILNYQGRHEEKEEIQMIKNYNGDEEDDDVRSDLSVLNEAVAFNGGSLTLIHPTRRQVPMKHPTFIQLFECEYDCYTISAVVFALSLELTAQDAILTRTYLRIRAALSSSEKYEKLKGQERESTETLLRVLSRNPSTYQHLKDSQKILAILDFFKDIKSMIQLQISNFGTFKMKQGKLFQFEGPLQLETDQYLAAHLPLEMLNLGNTMHAICFRFDVVDPLSVNTSLHVLQKRFDASNDKKLFYLFADDIMQKTIVVIDKKFHMDIARYYLPYLCTSPSFLKRPGTPGIIYPIHVNNYLYGGRKGLLYSMKSLLRLFCRTAINAHRSLLPDEKDEELNFFSHFSPILDRLVQQDTGEWKICELLQYLDTPFLNPVMLEYSTTIRTRIMIIDENDQVIEGPQFEENVASHFNPTYPTIYSGIKAMCFMKASHDIYVDVLNRVYNLFLYNQTLQRRWNLMWILVIHLKECVEKSKFDNVFQIRIPKGFLPEEEFPYPNYLIFYQFLAQEREYLTSEMAMRLFIGISVNYSKSTKPLKIKLSPAHPGLSDMLDITVKYKDYFNNTHQFKRNETNKQGYALTILFEYLEQNSYYPVNKTLAEIGEYAEQKVRSDYEQRPFDRWLPLFYDSVVSQQQRPIIPAYFDPQPVLFHNVFPIWKSEFLSTSPDGRGVVSSIEKSSSDLRPLVGSHPKFLQLISFHPCVEPIQLLETNLKIKQ